MNRVSSFALCCLFWCAGCASFERSIVLPFHNDESDLTDPYFKNSKAGKIEEIKRIAGEAQQQSADAQAATSKELVARLQRETDPTVRREIVRALGQFPTPASMDGLRMALADSNSRLRMSACEALGKIKTPEALSVLAVVLESDADLDVRVAATRAVAQFDGPAAIKALQPAVSDPDPALQFAAVQAMKSIHPEDLGNNVADWQALARSLPDSLIR